MIYWPDVLPKPQVNYSLGSKNGVIRTRMESGRIRQRRRFMDEQYQANVEWLLSDAQYHIFKSFLFYSLSGGADWFEIELPDGSGGLALNKARFVSEEQRAVYVPVGHWRVSARLDIETLHRPDEAQAFESIYGSIDQTLSDMSDVLAAYMPNTQV